MRDAKALEWDSAVGMNSGAAPVARFEEAFTTQRTFVWIDADDESTRGPVVDMLPCRANAHGRREKPSLALIAERDQSHSVNRRCIQRADLRMLLNALLKQIAACAEHGAQPINGKRLPIDGQL